MNPHVSASSADASAESTADTPSGAPAQAAPTRAARVRASTLRRFGAAGVCVAIIGCTMPWYSVGPATRLGTAALGRWALVLLVVVAALLVVERFRPDRRIVVAVEILLGVSALIAIVAAFRAPTSMTVSVGIITTLLGATIAAAALWSASRLDSGTPVAPGVPERPPRSGWGRAIRVAGAVAGVAAMAVLAVGFWPISLDGIDAQPDPTDSYDEALARFDQLRADEADGIYPPCASRLFDHGGPTEVVVVLFHGLTNCPRQYVELATEMHDQGATVIITRAPGHGIGDVDAIAGAGALRDLDAQQLAEYADEAIDIAAGLGDEVRVSGLSMGGVVALWAAQQRADVDRVVAIAPAMELPGVPNVVSTFFTNLFVRVPTVTRTHERHIDHDYAAFSTRGLAAMFALGQSVADDGLDTPAVVDDLVVMLNPDDPLVPEDDMATLMDAWRTAGTNVRVTEFDPIGLPHDLIDLGQPAADPDHVYPLVLTELGFADTWTDQQR